MKLTKKNRSIFSVTLELVLNPHMTYNTIHFATAGEAGDTFFRSWKKNLVASSIICQLKERKKITTN